MNMPTLTNEQLIATFNPANGSKLTAEDLETLRALTDEQIDVLADHFPNQPTRRTYLRLYDKQLPADKQLYQLSTWQNLRNVRKYSNRKNLIAWDFFTSTTRLAPTPPTGIKKSTTSPKKVIVDLTAKEAADELKKNIVDKPVQLDGQQSASKTSKATTSAKKGGTKTQTKQPANVVDNESAPDDQQFTSGENE